MTDLMSRIKSFFIDPEVLAAENLDLDLAAACLLLEIAWADQNIDQREREVARRQLRALFPDEADSALDALIEQAHTDVDGATALYPFTSTVNAQASQEDKLALLVGLWRVALADGAIAPLEEHLIRRVADLLHLTHSEFISAKLAARASNNNPNS